MNLRPADKEYFRGHMRSFPQEVEKFISANQLIPKGCQVIAGVSGGADSMALLLVLYSLREKFDLKLTVAHLNHGLRGNDAEADAIHVRSWCDQLNLTCHLRYRDIREMARTGKIGLEIAGREARREFFSDLVRELAAEGHAGSKIRVALAHHLDDQAESMMLHLGRGCGLDGLVGMRPRAGLYIRPLLSQSRKEIEAWLREQGICWRTDDSNNRPVTMRNRLRLQVMPEWRKALGYDPAPLLARTASALHDDQDYLARQAEAVYSEVKESGKLRLDILGDLHPALLSRVLRLYWSEITGSASDISMAHIIGIRKIIGKPSGGNKICLPGNRVAVVTEGYLHLDYNQQSAELGGLDQLQQGYLLKLPGETIIPDMNLRITALLIENESEIVYNNAMECFRLEDIRDCRIRYRLPGDRIHPQGRNCGKQLKKFFNEKKVPPAERDRIPLLAVGQEVIWLPGLAVGTAVSRPGDGRQGNLICLRISRLRPD